LEGERGRGWWAGGENGKMRGRIFFAIETNKPPTTKRRGNHHGHATKKVAAIHRYLWTGGWFALETPLQRYLWTADEGT
jgi:hypothetical protein